MLSAPDDRPPYLQLAQQIRTDIATGQLSRGDKIPSVRALAETHGLASATVQNAIKVLKTAGLLVSRKGQGVYVAEDADLSRGTLTLEGLAQEVAELRQRVAELETRTVAE
jgi:DNA-binding transcriptional regulator YhcF (GntR family)